MLEVYFGLIISTRKGNVYVVIFYTPSFSSWKKVKMKKYNKDKDKKKKRNFGNL